MATESASRVCSTVQNGIGFAERIEAARLITMDSQNLRDAWDLHFVVIQAQLKSTESSLKLYHDMLKSEDDDEAKAELCSEI